MNLEQFGQRLRNLRKCQGFTQTELARLVPVSPELISIWERAYQHRGRQWKPDRPSTLRLIDIFADQLNPNEAQEWVSLLGYKLGQTELQQIFSDQPALASLVSGVLAASQTNLKRLHLTPTQQLFGVQNAQTELQHVLETTESPWIVTIHGIGGIGKTSLARATVHDLTADRFYDIAWASAKQEEFLPGRGLQPADQSSFDLDTLADVLLQQLATQVSLAYSTAEKIAILTDLLKKRPYLIVIDNLETVVDYETFLPLLNELAKPTKFLLTSRHNLQAYSNVFCLGLQELNQGDTLDLLRHEARVRGLTALAEAPESALVDIYQIVGGNPLALKLVIGQTGVLPLSQVLDNLKVARGKKTTDLYNYIYWQAWRTLKPVSRELLLLMPLAQGGTFAQLTSLSRHNLDALSQALEHLIALSLVEVSGDIDQPRYRIHRLTETFLLTEIAQWQPPP
ncbi:MAG: hypothetical protein JXM69_15090 [Anaerolineae bacterium]|nr:hypothetical protein [Anaerolineae bacterium]